MRPRQKVRSAPLKGANQHRLPLVPLTQLTYRLTPSIGTVSESREMPRSKRNRITGDFEGGEENLNTPVHLSLQFYGRSVVGTYWQKD